MPIYRLTVIGQRPQVEQPRLQNSGVESQASRARRFVKRGKYRRIQRKKLRGKVKITTNYSDYPLTLAQKEF